MKVIEFLEKARSTLFSYEIIPPRRGGNIQDVFHLVDKLVVYEPPFIDLTSRSAEIYYEELPDGALRRHVKRKRPGTIGLSAAIKNRYNVETVPHILCSGFTREETEDALIELNYLGIHNILAVRGDELRQYHDRDGKTFNRYAADLVRQIVNMNNGKYLDTDLVDTNRTDFCIGVGGYPEKHFEAPNLTSDLRYLKEKVEAGADYIVTQMVFDNQVFFDYVKKVRELGITIPVIPGIKILTRISHLKTIPKTFIVDIPEKLAQEVLSRPAAETRSIGINWALQQCQELIAAAVPCIHFYIMTSADEVAEVVTQLK